MKRKLLFAMLLASVGMTAQTTHMVNWFMGVSNSQASKTIEVGDTVTWTWTDNLPHTVTSQGGGAETFSSGTISGNGQQYSHTFTEEGSTSYACDFHPMMQGTITVEAVMGIGENEALAFTAYPNPVADILTISSSKLIDKVEIYDLNGRMVMQAAAETPNVKVYMENFNAGTYMVKAVSGSETKTIAVVKK